MDGIVDHELSVPYVHGKFLLESEKPPRLSQSLPDKHAPIIVYCRSGARAKKACATLAKNGYMKIFNAGFLEGILHRCIMDRMLCLCRWSGCIGSAESRRWCWSSWIGIRFGAMWRWRHKRTSCFEVMYNGSIGDSCHLCLCVDIL